MPVSQGQQVLVRRRENQAPGLVTPHPCAQGCLLRRGKDHLLPAFFDIWGEKTWRFYR